MKDLVRLGKLLKPYLWQVLLSLLVLLLVTAARLAVPAIIGDVIDYGLVGGQEQYLVVAAAVILGIGFGLFYILIDRVSDSAILWPLVAARTASILLVFTLAFLLRQLEAPASRNLPAIALAGIFDTGGNVFFAIATRIGRLDVAAILSSLYPAVTVLLAWVILKERLTGGQWVGVLLVLFAIILIAV